MAGMDSGAMTLHQASRFAQQHGFKLSHQAISVYYAAVRLRRNGLLSKMTDGKTAADLL